MDVVIQLQLRKGLEMTPALETQLRLHDRRIVLRQKAYRFATYKPRTEAQMLDKLSKLDATPEESAEVISWLRSFDFVGDEEYVHRFLDDARNRKPLSQRDAVRRLRAKGISEELARTSVAEQISEEVELEAATAAARKKLRVLKGKDAHGKRRALTSFLAGRGFGWSTIKRALTDVGLMLGIVITCALCQATVLARPWADSTKLVEFSMDIFDQRSGLPVTSARVQAVFGDTIDNGVTVAPIELTVVGGTAHAIFREHDRVVITTNAPGYLTHHQVVRVRNLDTSTSLRLTARLIPIDRELAVAEFISKSCVLKPHSVRVLESTIPDIVARDLQVQLVGYSVLEWEPTSDSAMSTKRFNAIESLLVSKGVDSTSITRTLEYIPFHPYLLFAKEHPASRRVLLYITSK